MSQVFNKVGAAVGAAVLLLAAGAGAAGALDPNVVVQELREGTAARPAQRLVDAKVRSVGGGTRIDLVADGGVGTYELVELANPPRLALDLHGVKIAPRSGKSLGAGSIRGVRYGEHEGKVRVVIDAAADAPMPKYRIDRTANGLAVRFEGAAVAVAPAEAPKAGRVVVRDVAFAGEGASQVVGVELSKLAGYEVTRPDANTAVLTVKGATLPAELVRSLDTAAFNGPVRTVSSFVDARDGSVKVVVSLAQAAEDKVSVQGSKLSWSFDASALAEVIDESGSVIRSAPVTAAAAQVGQASKGQYTGRRVSFEFKDIDIHNLLRVIAEVSKRNIVVSDDVKGKITVRLRNVPWDQALDLVLKTKGLGKETTGNIIRIAPMQQLAAERDAAAKAAEARENSEPLKVRIIPVNYALAKDVEAKVQDLLTKRGSVTIDDRTNTLIVRDIQDTLGRAESLVRTLDTQTPQVLISARIVEASSNFSRDVGIQWGGNLTASSALGNSTGLAFPAEASARGGVPGAFGGGFGVPTQPNWAVSLPAAIAENQGGGIGFSFGSAGSAAMLNMRLTALETEGVLKTVSAPKVTTLDNKEAIIGQGISIPFSQVSAAGVNTVFVEAKLELKVTPHVTSDGSVLLKIKATNNQPNDTLTGANGQPSITKREAETEVLVKDGDTTVIGGIYTRKTAENLAQVPFFGDIPILGWLFKSRNVVDDRTELLIFISPTIVNRDASVVVGN
ncbi:type IV pilus secretin PilQ [Vulgatibacter sp.]|uniref:type IV pilus secretin PilQ n=1 Tax=Vulgatibacter sp. TaxID=1971226 RepID=UPI003563D567